MNAKRIAIYGKGGIGKTTLSVNLSIVFAEAGKKVLLVGCDPKRDTARLLTHQTIPTIVESYNDICSGKLNIKDVCVGVRKNLICCESGGPKPGVGCAGRGVMIALELLEKSGMLDDADIVLYDVLGDVVCGGFATPVTRGFTDRVYIVSSGEQASLLAANNILSGMNAVGGRIGGLIYNARGFTGEDDFIERYSEQTQLPIVGRMPYSMRVKLEELRRRAICDLDSADIENEAVRTLAAKMLEDRPQVEAKPLPMEDLYDMIARIGRERYDG